MYALGSSKDIGTFVAPIFASETVAMPAARRCMERQAAVVLEERLNIVDDVADDEHSQKSASEGVEGERWRKEYRGVCRGRELMYL